LGIAGIASVRGLLNSIYVKVGEGEEPISIINCANKKALSDLIILSA